MVIPLAVVLIQDFFFFRIMSPLTRFGEIGKGKISAIKHITATMMSLTYAWYSLQQIEFKWFV